MEIGRIPAVVLAAGYSSRMNAFKPLLPLGGGLVLEHVVESLRRAGVEDIHLVTGYDRERLTEIQKAFGLKEAHNPDFDRGMFSSIQAGVRNLPTDAPGCFLVPVDCPLFGSETIVKMARELGDGSVFAVPTYMGKKGHPLFVPRKHFAEIFKHDGKGGLKTITDKYFEETLRIPVEGEGILLDMDTQEDYQIVLQFLRNGQVSESLLPLAAGRRFLLIRHGQIRQHKEKIFLGQTDVPLSEEGRRQAEAAAEKVAHLAPETDRVYTSDLLRASETAEILKGNRELIPVERFREMSLGEWDGKFIEEIKRDAPEAYRLRGEYIWSYKKGNRSENFFDLQYRVVKGLIQILKEDDGRDVVIVAHKGVLRVIENNIKERDVSDPWNAMENGEVRVVKG